MGASKPKLGIIAGGGWLPVRLAEVCRETGRSYAVVAFEGWADAALDQHPHKRMGLGALGSFRDYLKSENVQEIVMAGYLSRPDFSKLKPDWQGIKMLPKVVMAARHGDDALLRFLIEMLEDEGYRVVGAHDVMEALLIEKGPLGLLGPDEEALGDIHKALHVVRAAGVLDIGQGAVVARGLVLAVEAQEGTDAMLARISTLPPEIRGNETERAGVLVKIPKPAQERRIDLPTIGSRTLAGAAAAGLKGIAVSAGGALVLDKAEVARQADALGLFVIGVDEEPDA